VIDGSELFRAGLKHTLAKTPFRVRLAQETLANLSARHKFKAEEKALLIVSLGHTTSSDITELSVLKRQNPQIRILVLSNSPSLEEFSVLVDAGADAYLQRADLTPPVLVNALHLIQAGKAVVPQEFIRYIKLVGSSGGQEPEPPSNNNSKPNGEHRAVLMSCRLSPGSRRFSNI
jgi:DNA-binding NarL/FixJ family response regulator